MNLRIRRRRFGQLVIASATAAAITNLASKVIAQTPSDTLYSASVSTTTSDANTTPSITVTSSNVSTGQQISSSRSQAISVSNASVPVESTSKSTSTQSSERLTGLTTLTDGTLVSTNVSISKSGNVSRLIFTDPKTSQTTNSLKISGFPNNNSTAESLLATRQNTLLSIISLNQGLPPFDLATIDRTTAKVTTSAAANLPTLTSGQRYSNLAQAADGTIYATNLGRQGTTYLVRIDLANKSVNRVVQLSYNNKPLSNDLLSLSISPSGQFYALANPNHESTNSLFTVDVRTGILSPVRQLNAEKITFPH